MILLYNSKSMIHSDVVRMDMMLMAGLGGSIEAQHMYSSLCLYITSFS